MNASDQMAALCLAGRIILENGGETYRAEDTVLHMARALRLQNADVFAVPSGLFISFTDENGELASSVNRVHLKGTHLARVDRVNQISRSLAHGQLSSENLLDELQKAQRLNENAPLWYEPLMAFLTAASFAVMFGGGWIDMLLGGLCGALTQVIPYAFAQGNASSRMASCLVGGMLCAVIPMVFHAVTGLCSTEAVIASAIMPLVPGLSMTNAVQDILRGDMVSGVAHCARAVMIAAMIAGGALVGTHLISAVGLMAQSAPQPSAWPLWMQAILMGVSSFGAGAGFGALLFSPKKAIGVGGFIGAAGYLAYWLLMQMAVGETAAMFVGALLAALLTQAAARRQKMITTIYITIAILPMVPGLGLYRAMSALAQGDLALGGGIAMHTMALIVMIALGIGLGAMLAGLRRREKKA